MFIHQLVENWACGFGRIVFINLAQEFVVVRWSYLVERFDYLTLSEAKRVLKFYSQDESKYVEVK